MICRNQMHLWIKSSRRSQSLNKENSLSGESGKKCKKNNQTKLILHFYLSNVSMRNGSMRCVLSGKSLYCVVVYYRTEAVSNGSVEKESIGKSCTGNCVLIIGENKSDQIQLR